LVWQAGHEKSIAKLLEQAEQCNGKKINKLWNKFQKHYPLESKKTTMQEFCAAVDLANKNGTACNGEAVPERNDILRIVFGND
jgi:hypothetical protein